MYNFWDYFAGALVLGAFLIPIAIAIVIKLGFLLLGLLIAISPTVTPKRATKSGAWEQCAEDY